MNIYLILTKKNICLKFSTHWLCKNIKNHYEKVESEVDIQVKNVNLGRILNIQIKFINFSGFLIWVKFFLTINNKQIQILI